MSGRAKKSKYFKWSLEKRLLLIEALKMVEEDRESKLRTVEKVMQMSCGTTAEAAAAAVTTIPFKQNEKWEEVASRLPSIFDAVDHATHARRGSICLSQFVKLQQKLKLMKPHGRTSYRRANGQRDPIMTSELCRKLIEYQASSCLSNEKKARGKRLPLRSDTKGLGEHFHLRNETKGRGERLPLGSDKKGRGKHFPVSIDRKRRGEDLPLCTDKKRRGEQLPLSNHKKGRGEHLRLCKDKKGRGEHFPVSNDRKRRGEDLSLCNDKKRRGEQLPLSNHKKGREEHLRLCNDKKGRGEQLPLSNHKKGRGEHLRNLCNDKKGHGEHFPLSNDMKRHGEHIPSSSDQKGRGEHFPLSNDEEDDGKHSPSSSDQKGSGEQSPLCNDQEGRGEHSSSNSDQKDRGEHFPFSSDEERTGEHIPLSSEEKRCGEHIPSSNENQLCTVPQTELAASQEVALQPGRPQQKQNSQQLAARELSGTRIVKAVDYSRTNMFRWCEESRLQVIKGVMTMENNLSRAGQVRCWRAIAECLPKKFFWDVDLDRLATIAKKQFSEMRRRYLMLKSNENSGAMRAMRFNTMTEKVLREMDIYEEKYFHRPAPAGALRELCSSSNNYRRLRWFTKKPRLLRIRKADLGIAHGTVRVEIFISSVKGIEDDSSRSFYIEEDSYDDGAGRDEYGIVPLDIESSDYDQRERVDWQTAAPGSNSEFNHYSEKSYRETFEDSPEQNPHDVQSRQTVSSSDNTAADWYSEPYHRNDYERNVIKESLRRQRDCSSFVSCSDHSLEDDGNYRKNQQGESVFCDRQRRAISGGSEDPGWNSRESQGEESDDGALKEEFLLADSDPQSENPKNGLHLRNQAGSQSRSSVDSDSEESLQDRHLNLEEYHEDCQRFTGSHSDSEDDKNGSANYQTDAEHLEHNENKKQERNHNVDLQRQIYSKTRFRQSAADDSDSHSPDQNGNERNNDESESRHRRHSDQAEYDSVSTENDSKSHRDSDNSVGHEEWNNNHSEREDFVQSHSGGASQNNRSQEILQTKSCSSHDSQWDESIDRGLLAPRTTHPQRDHHRARRPRKRARANVEFKHREEIPSSRMDSSEPEHDEVFEDPPLLHEVLKKVDLEFSRLNWWVNHQLFPMGREKITSGIKSASIPNTPKGAAGGYDDVISKCRQKRIMWVLKAEFQQVRLKLVEEIEKSSHVVVQEVLQSFRI